MAKWVILLNEFEIQYADRKSIDHLTKIPLIDTHSLITKFPDEYIYTITIKAPGKFIFMFHIHIMDQG